jgi:hypothetical protein
LRNKNQEVSDRRILCQLRIPSAEEGGGLTLQIDEARIVHNAENKKGETPLEMKPMKAM